MDEAARSPLIAWESFYVIIGSSGAALTGLQFVVIALIAETPRKQSTPQQIAAFGTPTIIHFCAVLLMSAILSAPWVSLSSVSLALAVCGVAGVVYGLIVTKRARSQVGYRPVLEDWLFHAVFPLIAYAALLVAAIVLASHPQRALFVIGGTALLLLFIGIHNSWDTVTYIAIGLNKSTPEEPEVQKEAGDQD